MKETRKPNLEIIPTVPPRRHQEQSSNAPNIDVNFSQSMGAMWGDIRKGYTPTNDTQATELDDFFSQQQDIFKRLGSERRVAQVHQDQSKEREEFADGLPMLVDFIGRAKKNERAGYPKDLKKQMEQKDQRNARLFLDTAKKLFPHIKPPESFADANAEVQRLSNTTRQSTEAMVVKSALGLFKDPSIGLKRRIEILDDLIAQIGDLQMGNANYGQIDSSDQPFGAVNKQQAIEAARLVYRINLVRDQFQKELYGRENVSASEAQEIDGIRGQIDAGRRSGGGRGVLTADELERAKARVARTTIVDRPTAATEKLIPIEESNDLAEVALGNKKFDLGKNGPMTKLYDTHKTIEDIRRAVTPEMKRALLEKMLHDVDSSIQSAIRVITKPGEILNRRTVSQFCGMSAMIGEAPVYQKIAIANEGRIIDTNEIGQMSMVDYLHKYLGYDIKKDNRRAEMLQKYTNAFT